MKIVVATPLYHPEIGDTAIYIRDLSEHLSIDNSLTIVAYTNFSGEDSSKIKLVSVKKRLPLLIRLFKYSTFLFNASRGADVIYAQNAVVSGLPAVIVGKLLNVPVVINFISDEAWVRFKRTNNAEVSFEKFFEMPGKDFKIKILLFLQGFAMRRANSVIAVSDYLENIVKKYYRVSSLKVSRNYIPTKKIEILPFQNKFTLHQVFMATNRLTLTEIEPVIKAIVSLKEKLLDIHIFIFSNSLEKNKIETYIRNLQVEGNITILNGVSHAEKVYILKNSHLSIISNKYDESDSILFESYNLEVPVIVLNLNSTSGIIDSVESVFNDEDLKKSLINKGKEYIAQNVSWETHKKNLINVFNQSTKSHG